MTATVTVKGYSRRRPEKPRVYLDTHASLWAEVCRDIGDILARDLAEVLAAFVAEVRGH